MKRTVVFSAMTASVAACTGAARAENQYWVGYQNGCMVSQPGSASFFHGDNWLNFTVPGTGDVAIFGSGVDPQDNGAPHHVHFGDFCVNVFACPNTVQVPGATATNVRAVVASGAWTFDFNPGSTGGCSPGNDNGDYSLTAGNRSVIISDIVESTGSPGVAQLTIEGDGTLSAGEVLIAEEPNTQGTLNVMGASTTLTASQNMAVGNGGDGTLVISDGAQVFNTYADVGRWTAAASGTVQVSGSGSQWNSSEYVLIGYLGSGSLTVSDGAHVSNTWSHIGSGPGSSGAVTVTGPASNWSTEFLGVGDGAPGSLLISSGGVVNSANVHIGGYENGDGTATVTGDTSQWNCSANVIVGREGEGELVVSNGGNVSSSWARVSELAASTGQVTLSGSDSNWSVGGQLDIGFAPQTQGTVEVEQDATLDVAQWIIVGREGDGELVVSNGGNVSSSWARVSELASSTGYVTVSGSDSSWSVGGQLDIGFAPQTQGTVEVEQGATLDVAQWMIVGREGSGLLSLATGGVASNTAFARLGELAGSDGEVIVSGTGSAWTVAGPLDLGFSIGASGALTIEGGGLVSVSAPVHSFIGDAGSGQCNVSDSGSLLIVEQALTIGQAGQGSLTLEDGGHVEVSGTNPDFGGLGILGGLPGALGTLTISGSDSQWQSAAQLQVGREGNGSANVLNGGRLWTNKSTSPTGSSGIIATLANSVGSVTIAGLGSTWEQDGGLSAGFFGSGVLTVSEGGQVHSQAGFVARYAGSVGQVTISGPGSAWSVSEAFFLGGDAIASGGDASLTVAAGGQLLVGESLTLWSGSPVAIAGGTIHVGPSQPDATPNHLRIWPGGTVSGEGQIAADAMNGGILAPGNSVGTLEIDGSYLQIPDGALEIDLTSLALNAPHDLVSVSGPATLSGAITLSLAGGGTLAAGQFIAILTAASINGTFDSVTFVNFPTGVPIDVVYTPEAVGLMVSPDCNNNGVGDVQDIASGTSPDVNGSGIPDECELVQIASANPPIDNPFVAGVQPFRDVLQPGAGPFLNQGIGAAGTPPQHTVTYAPISITFSAPPLVVPTPQNVGISCTNSPPTFCPSVVGVSASPAGGAGSYVITLSGPIPLGQCTTLLFASTLPGAKLQYQYLPGDVNLNGSTSPTDVLALTVALNNGQAALPANLPRYNINRSGAVTASDVLRLVQLLNGVNSPAPFSGVSVAACP